VAELHLAHTLVSPRTTSKRIALRERLSVFHLHAAGQQAPFGGVCGDSWIPYRIGSQQEGAAGMLRRWDPRLHWAALAAFTCCVLLGCSKHSPPVTPTATGTAPPFAHSSSSESDQNDPCSLLDPKEVEAALGAPLAVPPYRSYNGPFGPIPSGSSCIYETAKFRFISLEVTYSGGTQAYSMVGMTKSLMKSAADPNLANNVKKNFKLDDGTEISGEWDEASLTPMNCCIFSGLRGDQLITIDFTASPATLRQAAMLVDSAYKRIAHPLKIDGGASVEAAKALQTTRPKPVDVCSILTRAEVEAILGTLSANPTPAGQSGCNYLVPGSDNTRPEYDVQISWTGGYADWRSKHHVAGIGMASLNQIVADVRGGNPLPGMSKGEADSKVAAGKAEPASGGDPAEAIDTGYIGGFTMVKRDVMVTVNGGFVDPAKEKALLAAIVQKL
jgi:hypothetical protein